MFGSVDSTAPERLRTSNILNGDVLVAFTPETLVIRKINEGALQGFKVRDMCYVESGERGGLRDRRGLRHEQEGWRVQERRD